jgi:hypothetical protein
MATDDRRRIAERAAALDAWLVNLPKVGHPGHGDEETADRALQAFEERRPARDRDGAQP